MSELAISIEEAGRRLGLRRSAAYVAFTTDPKLIPCVTAIGKTKRVSVAALQRVLEVAAA